MAVINIAGGTSGDTGALGSNTIFFVQSGKVHLSSDGGTSKIPFDAGEKVVRSAGLTITYHNDQATPAILVTDPI